MNIEDHIASLDLCIKLKELGIKQDSIYYWSKTAPTLTSSGTDKPPEWKELHLLDKWTKRKFDTLDTWSAFTVGELGEMLPVYIEDEKCITSEIMMGMEDEEYTFDENNEPTILVEQKRYWIGYRSLRDQFPLTCSQTDENEANVRAKIIIYLIENKLMELPQ